MKPHKTTQKIHKNTQFLHMCPFLMSHMGIYGIYGYRWALIPLWVRAYALGNPPSPPRPSPPLRGHPCKCQWGDELVSPSQELFFSKGSIWSQNLWATSFWLQFLPSSEVFFARENNQDFSTVFWVQNGQKRQKWPFFGPFWAHISAQTVILAIISSQNLFSNLFWGFGMVQDAWVTKNFFSKKIQKNFPDEVGYAGKFFAKIFCKGKFVGKKIEKIFCSKIVFFVSNGFFTPENLNLHAPNSCHRPKLPILWPNWAPWPLGGPKGPKAHKNGLKTWKPLSRLSPLSLHAVPGGF